MKGVPSQGFRRWVFDKIDLSNSCIYQSKWGRSAKAERLPPTVCSVWRRNWLVLADFEVEFLFPFLLCIHGWCSTGSHCLSSDQILLFLLSASSARAGLWQSRLWILLLAWSQGDAEKLTSEATAVNGITALLGTTLASLSFPPPAFPNRSPFFLSVFELVCLFCFTVTFPSPPPTDAVFPFYSPILCSLRALPGCTALPEESWHTSTDVINNVGFSPCSFPSPHGAWLSWLQNLPCLISPKQWDTSSRSLQIYLHFKNWTECFFSFVGC